MTTGTAVAKKEVVKVIPMSPLMKVLMGCEKCGVVMTFEQYLDHVRECE